MPHDEAQARAVSKLGGSPLGGAGPVPDSVPIMRAPLPRLARPLPRKPTTELRTSPRELPGMVSSRTGGGSSTARSRNNLEPLDPRLSYQDRSPPSARHAGLVGISTFAFDLSHYHRLRHCPLARSRGAGASLRQSAPQRGAPHSSPCRSPSLQRPALSALAGELSQPESSGSWTTTGGRLRFRHHAPKLSRQQNNDAGAQGMKTCTSPPLTNDK